MTAYGYHGPVAALGDYDRCHMHPQDHVYRAYTIGEDGHIIRRVDLHCDDDATARQQAEALVDGRDVELWDGARKIETFKCFRPTKPRD